MALCTTIATLALAGAANAQVRISQVFGGAGCTTPGCSAYTNDYVELFNAGASAVDLSTWSIQYASATGNFTQRLNLTGSIQPGSYYLIQLAGNTNGLLPLPTPDATGTISMAAGAGKVALVNTQVNAPACPDASIVDLVGYGTTANCFETSAAPAPGSNFNAIFRALGGCTDTNNNGADFSAAAAAPRNSSNSQSCGATTGACCNGTICSIDTPANCAGAFQGLGSTCTPVDPCVPQVGACCVNGICVGDLTEIACLQNGTGSTWGGIGTTCATFTCPVPTGSCCIGIACSITEQANCAGTWTLNQACTPTNPCDPVAACCFPSAGSCILRTSADCATLGGNYLGIGSVCNTNTCPVNPGACCTGNTCATAADPIACYNSGGQFKGYGTSCTPNPCFVATGDVITIFDFDANVVGTPAANLAFVAAPDNAVRNGAFPGSAFDVFGVTDRTINADIADDSLLGADTVGILRSTETGKVFGVEDLLNPDNAPGTGTATFTFDVSGYNNLSLSVDCAAFGNFEAFGTGPGSVADVFKFSVSIDGGPASDVIVSNIYEGLTPTYTLESGATNTTTNDPAAMNGALILNRFITIQAPITGSGSTLTVTFFASNDGGGEVFLFDNIVIRGTPAGGNGACCSGSTCTSTTAAGCTGTFTQFAGIGTVCNLPNNFTTPCCKADYNQSGTLTVQDIFDFLAGYFSADAKADINGGGISVQDIFDYLAAYFAGCA
jgi:hypothetical protein